MKKIKVGHIGWLSYDQGEDCETVAWCDTNETKLKNAGEKHPDLTLYTDYREMLKHPGLDAVVISTPNWVHTEQAIAFMEAGISVFVEKPAGITKEECDRLLQVAVATGQNLTVDFEMRVSIFAERIKELIDSGKYGGLRRIETVHHRGAWLNEGGGAWRVVPEKSGGHFLMEPIHMLDIYRFFGGEIQAVQTFAGPNVLPQYNFPDNFCCHVFFESGAQATMLVSHTASAWHSWKDQKDIALLQRTGHDMYMIFTLERASIMVDFLRASILINEIEDYPDGKTGRRVVFKNREEYGDSHAFTHDINKMRRDFIRRCATGEPMLQNPIDQWKTHLVCIAAEKSMTEESQRIELNYTLPEGV